MERIKLELAGLNRKVSNGISKAGFTLAEVLIVVAIIGVVAAIVLPTILDITNNSIWNKQSEVFEAKLYTALKIMNVKGDLARLDSTEEFMNRFRNYFKIIDVCDNNNLKNCFNGTLGFVSNNEVSKTKTLDELNYKVAADFGLTQWQSSNIMGVRFANGITGLMAYNTNCLPKSNNKEELMNCIALMYDVNAKAQPNAFTMDVRTINVPMAGDCVASTSDYCVAFVKPENGIDCTVEENAVPCTRLSLYFLNSDNTHHKNNKVVTANEMCRDMGMELATTAQLDDIYNGLGDEFREIIPSYGVSAMVSRDRNSLPSQCLGMLGAANGRAAVGGYIYDNGQITRGGCTMISSDFIGACVKNK